MTNDNNTPTLSDADLDMYLDAYKVPSFDEEAFEKRLMTAINSGSNNQSTPPTAFVWFRPLKYAMAAMVAFFAAVLYFQTQGVPSSESGRVVMAGANDAQITAPDERTIIASAGPSMGELESEEMFYSEMADQDILLTDYMPSGYGAMDNTSTGTTGSNPPPIDEFLDELLGMESRQL